MASSGGPITPNRYNNSLIESGSIGSSGAPFTTYGQLSVSTPEYIYLNTADEWVAIPFNTFNPSLHVNGSTSTPATLTILKEGIYLLNVSLYFSSEDSPEETFTQTTYTLGISTNGASPVASGAVYAGEPGAFSLSYSILGPFSTNDYIRFYMKPSAVGAGGPFENVVRVLNGNAHVVQIAQ